MDVEQSALLPSRSLVEEVRDTSVKTVQAPRVSVGMPVYNGERFLEEALDSILGQSFEDFELVISDNASVDGTEAICRRYASKDDRIRYFRARRNYGIAENFNAVFRLSRGEYFKWAASDDVCGREYLERAVDVLDHDSSIVVAWAKTRAIDESGSLLEWSMEISDLNAPWSVHSHDPVVRFRRLVRNWWWAAGPFYGLIRARALDSTQLHRRHTGGDQLLLAELSLLGRFYEIPEELFFVRRSRHSAHLSAGTLKQRTTLAQGRTPRPEVLGWWTLLRGYPERIWTYLRIVSRAPLDWRKKLICYWESIRPMFAWFFLRAGQVLSGRSPWRSSS
jgi:glycosyltransferase involved in cell wall biosynthesis